MSELITIRCMIIKPKVRGFVCITSHPDGCAAHIQEQINYVCAQKPLKNSPKRILILGASTGYGLSSRIVTAIGGGADTFGVFYERPGEENKAASPGWYNSVAFEQAASARGLKSYSMNGDAFSLDFKHKVIDALKDKFGTVDCVIYSLAAPRKTDSLSGEVYRSVLKPIGQKFRSKTLNTDKGEVLDVELEPASEDEIYQTIKVMGGEDWEEWIHLLCEHHVLAPQATTIAYSYIGPKTTWPIYKEGTIGKAKAHLTQTAEKINTYLHEQVQGRALVSVNKAVVTQASSAIPVVPLYLSILFKVMKAKGTHEDCIQQMYRLFAGLFDNAKLTRESETCVRLDDLELDADTQAQVQKIWEQINSQNLRELSDFDGYKANFLKLFGFENPQIDYEKEVNPQRMFSHLIE